MDLTDWSWDTIDAIFIDAGGVLLRPDYKRFQALCQPEILLPDEDIDRALYVHGAVGAGLGPGDDDDAFVREFALAAGMPAELVQLNFDEIREIVLFSPWVPRSLESCISAFRHFSRAGKLLAVVSNTENGGVATLLADLSICQVGEGKGAPVEAIVDSAEIGIHKPDPEIYKYTARLLGVPIERCLHVGDSIRNDVDAAFAAGATGVHFSPFGTCNNPCRFHIKALPDLVEGLRHD